ncbi:MAG: glycosyltransferase family 4 protein [Beijerinckiaceae bacterium]|nr:glycosyltransferase family 4 protein [Beijerinckiaceae bacterium]
MTSVAFAIPGDLSRPTGGYAYDRHVLRLLPEFGVEPVHVALPGSFPEPSDADLAETSRLLLAQDWRTPLLIDGLAYGAFPTGLAAGLAGRVIALCHHPLGLETGLDAARAADLIRLETAALGYAGAVIVTSRATRDILIAQFGVPAGRITVAEPGVEPAGRASERRFGEAVRLLAVGSLSPRKGYDILIEALAAIPMLPWHLTIIGTEAAGSSYGTMLRALIAAKGLESHVTLHGALTDAEVDAHYRNSDIFVMASHYEGYGMALTEALARGLPIVTTLSGSGAMQLPDAAAQKVAPGDAGGLAGALAYLIGDAGARLRHADAAWAAAASLPRWTDTARIIATVCKTFRPQG